MKIKNAVRGCISFIVGCSKCDGDVSPNDKFCRHCGAELTPFGFGKTSNQELTVYPCDISYLLGMVKAKSVRPLGSDPAGQERQP